HRRRPRLLAISRLIERTPPAPEPPGPSWSHHVPLLDLDPAVTLAPRAARIDRLIRSILADPKGLDLAALESVAERSARQQAPAAPPRLVAEALDRLAPWVAGPLAREIARAAEVRRTIAWSIAWPRVGPVPTVTRGVIDFAYRDRRGGWRLVTLAGAAASEPRERLRLLLSAVAARELGIEPILQGWSVRLGPGGGLHGEEDFSDEAIDRSFQQLIDSIDS
ncbi:MAG: hypothetical protein IRY99_25320, partial [Isosphaeraceae bacterium]|nr:hypothetical protein [Isosphaeraceae bacterium]